MSKFSVVYVKQHPVMFGTIFLVFGVLLWVLLSRGHSAAATTTVANAPADPNVLAAQVQLTEAQLASQTQVDMGQLSLAANKGNNDTQVTLAGMALTAQLQQIQADHQLSEDQLTASTVALTTQLANNFQISHDNNQFMLDYAKNAQDTATEQLAIGADLQKSLSADQLKAYTLNTLAAQIPNLRLHGGQRVQAFDLLTSSVYGKDVSIGGPNPIATGGAAAPAQGSSGGGFNPLSLVGGVAGAVAGIFG